MIWAEEAAPQRLHTLTFGALGARAAHVAVALRALGCCPGDAVAIDLPLTVEAVVAYLGIVLAGCAVVSIADSFVAREIAARLRISGARAIFTQDVIPRGGRALPLYARVAEAGAPTAIVVPAAPGGALQVCRIGRLRRCSERGGSLLSGLCTGQQGYGRWRQHHGTRSTNMGVGRTNMGVGSTKMG